MNTLHYQSVISVNNRNILGINDFGNKKFIRFYTTSGKKTRSFGVIKIFDVLSEPKRVVSVVFLTLLALAGYYGGKVIWDRYHPPPVKGFLNRTYRIVP